MPTLLIDTASETLVVGVADAGELRGEAVDATRRAQAVLELVDTALERAGTTRGELDSVAVGIGPGGFTGLRIGVATARGIARALGVPLAPLPTLAAVAWRAWGDPEREQPEVAWAALDAKRGEVFLQPWRRVAGIAGFSMLAEGELQVVAAGDVAGIVGQHCSETGPPDARGLAELALTAAFGDPALVLPEYGRQPDATPPRMVAAP